MEGRIETHSSLGGGSEKRIDKPRFSGETPLQTLPRRSSLFVYAATSDVGTRSFETPA